MTVSSLLHYKTIDGSHDFRIKGYSLLKSQGYVATSVTFKVGGYSWLINFHPVGITDAYERPNTDCVSIFLLSVDGNGKSKLVSANVDMILLEQGVDNGTNYYVKRRTDELFITGSSIGWPRYITHANLESSNYLKNDCIHLRCCIGIIPTPSTKECHIDPIMSLPTMGINRDLGRLLESGRGTDISFEVEGQKFYAHKSILAARSPVFDALFFGSMSDPNATCITIQEMAAPVFKALLDFMYRDESPEQISDSMYQCLLVAADRYGFDRLKLYCEAKLCEKVCVTTAASSLITAELMNCPELKSQCVKFIAASENIERIMESDGYRDITLNYPKLLVDLLKAVARNKA